jgi:hypothetical protein
MTCIELSPYYGKKVAHEVNCFRSFSLVILVRQAPPKGRGAYVEHQIERTVRPLGLDSPCAPRLD